MCTVAFVPLGGGGYVVGHNRDERPARAAGEPPREIALPRCRALAPRDPEAGGTWIAVNASGVTVCILNAAEGRPERLPPEPRSRGLVVRDLACARDLEEVRKALDGSGETLRRTRAFHVVAAEPGARVGRFRWDGMAGSWEEGTAPALFVSSLLDPLAAERERSARWRLAAASGPLDRRALEAFLAGHEPERGPLSVCMHRPDAGTVSRTVVEVSAGRARMRYLPGAPCTPSGPETSAHIPTAVGCRG
jgi:hypothetical protein